MEKHKKRKEKKNMGDSRKRVCGHHIPAFSPVSMMVSQRKPQKSALVWLTGSVKACVPLNNTSSVASWVSHALFLEYFVSFKGRCAFRFIIPYHPCLIICIVGPHHIISNIRRVTPAHTWYLITQPSEHDQKHVNTGCQDPQDATGAPPGSARGATTRTCGRLA